MSGPLLCLYGRWTWRGQCGPSAPAARTALIKSWVYLYMYVYRSNSFVKYKCWIETSISSSGSDPQGYFVTIYRMNMHLLISSDPRTDLAWGVAMMMVHYPQTASLSSSVSSMSGILNPTSDNASFRIQNSFRVNFFQLVRASLWHSFFCKTWIFFLSHVLLKPVWSVNWLPLKGLYFYFVVSSDSNIKYFTRYFFLN